MNDGVTKTGFDLSGYYSTQSSQKPGMDNKFPGGNNLDNTGVITADSTTLREIIDNAPVAIQIVGPNGTFIDCNRKTFQLFCAQSPDDIIGQPPSILSPILQQDGRTSKEVSMEKISEAFSGKTVSFSWFHKKLNNYVFPAKVTLNHIMYDGIPCLMASVVDTSDIHDQIEETTSLIRESSSGIFSLDKNGKIVDVNPAVITITGYTRQELCSMHYNDIPLIKSEGETIEDAIRLLKPVNGKMVIRTKNGIRYLQSTYIPVLTQKKEVQLIFTLISDQTSLIEKINEAGSLVRENPAGILTTDSEGKLIHVNHAFKQISQMNEEKLLNMQIHDFSIISKTGDTFKDVKITKKPGKGKIVVKFGSDIRILESTYIPVLNASSEIDRVVIMFIDVTQVDSVQKSGDSLRNPTFSI